MHRTGDHNKSAAASVMRFAIGERMYVMSRILVLYGTTDGQTAKIAGALGNALRTQGSDVDVVEAGRDAPGPEGYAGIVVAASLHAGGYQRPVRQWVRTHAHALNEKPTAFLSVCLAVLQQEPKVQQDLSGIIGRFLTGTGWQPTVTKPVAGALLYTRYNPIKRWVMKRIVRKAGGDTDTSRDYEYTDWNDLRAFAEQFGSFVQRDAQIGGVHPAQRPRVA
jgi:menaquinone-dependent protoporphyrinogen oxidase